MEKDNLVFLCTGTTAFIIGLGTIQMNGLGWGLVLGGSLMCLFAVAAISKESDS